MSGRHGILPALAGVALLSLALSAPAAAQATALRGFQSTGDSVLLVAGRPVPGARIYRASAATLVISSEFPAPVLLQAREGVVQTVQLLKVAEMPNGSIDLLPGYVLADQGRFSIDELEVHFSVGGRAVVLGPKPPLLGLNRLEDLREHDPGYRQREEAYEPSGPILARLREETDEVRVRVFFGSWCPACAQMVPRIMRVADALRGSKVNFEFYGLPQGFDGEPEATRYDIHSVPTALVFVNGREVGRISGNGWKLPELAITNLLSGA